ncbi:MAG: response regulator [Phyllobacteriaceae bacterium]|nr:response regulator [Phyllobacteriaceae bacterium]
MRLLFAEDNVDLAEWLVRLLRRENYAVDLARDGEEAEAALALGGYDLVLLDLDLPRLDGWAVLRGFRGRDTETPVLILTADDAVSARIRGLDGGADDYLVKPFEPSELFARIRAHLRRARPNRAMEVRFGPLAYDGASRTFTIVEEVLNLTPRESAVLEALILRSGKPVRKESLFDTVFGHDEEANPSAIEIHVHRLRKKLEGSGVGVVTLRGLGYVLSEER